MPCIIYIFAHHMSYLYSHIHIPYSSHFLTILQTMDILRRYCMGGNSVGFQILSDQKECLRSVVSGRANYEDEFYSVSSIYKFFIVVGSCKSKCYLTLCSLSYYATHH